MRSLLLYFFIFTSFLISETSRVPSILNFPGFSKLAEAQRTHGRVLNDSTLLSSEISGVASTPTLIESSKHTGGNATPNSVFGYATALEGDILVVSASGLGFHGITKAGKVYVYKYNLGVAQYEKIAELKSTISPKESDIFGSNVVINGDVIVVSGIVDSNDDGQADKPEVYVFEKPELGWIDATANATLSVSDTVETYFSGRFLTMSGNDIVFGGRVNTSEINRGAVYVFEKPNTGWIDATENAKLTASDSIEMNTEFGISVTISNDNIVVGAPDFTQNEMTNFSAIYIFEKPYTGWITTTEDAKLTASDVPINNIFGYSVGMSENTIIVGAPNIMTIDEVMQAGAAYIFEKPLSGWVDANEDAKLMASNPIDLAYFGFSVAIDGNNIVVGDLVEFGLSADDNITQLDAAYIFKKPLSGWMNATEDVKLIASDAIEADGFSYSLSIDGDNIVVGAPTKDNEIGAVYHYKMKKQSVSPSVIMYLLN